MMRVKINNFNSISISINCYWFLGEKVFWKACSFHCPASHLSQADSQDQQAEAEATDEQDPDGRAQRHIGRSCLPSWNRRKENQDPSGRFQALQSSPLQEPTDHHWTQDLCSCVQEADRQGRQLRVPRALLVNLIVIVYFSNMLRHCLTKSVARLLLYSCQRKIQS